jgi:hypothetical protein
MKYIVFGDMLCQTATLEMADSGQQPTARAEVDTLVDEIFEMLMDMEIKRINHSSHKLYILYYGTCPPSPQKSVRGACANFF